MVTIGCLLLIGVLFINTIYLFVLSVAGSFFGKVKPDNSPVEKSLKMLIIFPAYKEDKVIVQSVNNMQAQHYLAENYKTIVIADELKEETLLKIWNTGAVVCSLPSSEKRSKAHAINHVLENLTEDYDVCVIMDADNVVEGDFLSNMNQYFVNGATAVQARRVAKNNTNGLSQLDNYSEIINNHIFRKGQRAIGFSSSLIGSGMAFEFNLFKEVMKDMDVFSGFDKELELRLLERNILIEYAENIVVYDEKVSEHEVFINQRRRWIYAQLHFLKNNVGNAFLQVVIYRNFDYANKIFQFSLLPRIITLGLCTLLLAITPLISIKLFAATTGIALMLAIALALPIQSQVSISMVIASLVELPRVFINMVFAALTSGKAAGKFLHTPHNSK